jgi:hypothetical protein
MIGVAGLRRYGYAADADRVARKFLGLVTKEFEEHGTIVEKYDVRRRESDVEAGIRFGYAANQIGFGWTNAAYLDLLKGLERKRRPRAAPRRGRVASAWASPSAPRRPSSPEQPGKAEQRREP